MNIIGSIIVGSIVIAGSTKHRLGVKKMVSALEEAFILVENRENMIWEGCELIG